MISKTSNFDIKFVQINPLKYGFGRLNSIFIPAAFYFNFPLYLVQINGGYTSMKFLNCRKLAILLFVTTCFCLLLPSRSFAQQWNQSSFTPLNPYREHAAYAGFDQSIAVHLHLRNQWVSLPGSPRFLYGGFHLPLYLYNMGVGFDLQSASDGVLQFRTLRASASRVFNVAGGSLALGGRVGLLQLGIDGTAIRTPGGNYENGNFDHNDPILGEGKYTGNGFLWEASLFYRNASFQTGLSVMDVPRHPVEVDLTRFGLNSHAMAFFQYSLPLTQNVHFQPSVVVRTDLNKFQTEIHALARINGNIFGGVMLRGNSSSSWDALGFCAGHRINRRYTVFYQYDAGISSLRRSHEGSHELMLRINFYNLPATGKPPKIIYNPRFLE